MKGLLNKFKEMSTKGKIATIIGILFIICVFGGLGEEENTTETSSTKQEETVKEEDDNKSVEIEEYTQEELLEMYKDESYMKVSGNELDTNPNKYNGKNIQVMGQVEEKTFKDNPYGYGSWIVRITVDDFYRVLVFFREGTLPNIPIEGNYILVNGRGQGITDDYSAVKQPRMLGHYIVNEAKSKDDVYNVKGDNNQDE